MTATHTEMPSSPGSQQLSDKVPQAQGSWHQAIARGDHGEKLQFPPPTYTPSHGCLSIRIAYKGAIMLKHLVLLQFPVPATGALDTHTIICWVEDRTPPEKCFSLSYQDKGGNRDTVANIWKSYAGALVFRNEMPLYTKTEG